MKITKKKIVIGGILGGIAIGGYFISRRIKKLMDYSILITGVKFRETSVANLIFDLNLNFKNNSDIKIVLENQNYDVFLNDKFITTISSEKEQLIKPDGISPLSLTVDVKPSEIVKELGSNPISEALKLVTNFQNQRLKVKMKFGVKFGFLTIPLTFTKEELVKNWKIEE
jgi:LEA14-like dessication related protein